MGFAFYAEEQWNTSVWMWILGSFFFEIGFFGEIASFEATSSRSFSRVSRRVCKIRKATISWVMFLCLPVCLSLRKVPRLLMDGFSWKLIFEYFSKNCRENTRFIKMDKIMCTGHDDQYTRIKYLSQLFLEREMFWTNLRENQNKYFVP